MSLRPGWEGPEKTAPGAVGEGVDGLRISDLLRQRGAELTPAEARVARTLLADYPLAGLGTVASLARRAGVSDPTVVRLVAKLGLAGGYPAFQKALLEEVEARLRSPLMMMEARGTAKHDVSEAYLEFLEGRLAEMRQQGMTEPYARAIDMLADRKLRLTLLGGRFSRYLAGILYTHLVQLRPGVRHLDGTTAEAVDALVDLGRQDMVVIFDYRRYQADVVDFATEAAARGARILLFTDPYRSPVAAVAQLVLTAPVEASSPYDSMVPALAQMEALLAGLLKRRGHDVRQRLEDIEALRRRRGVTLG
ncbi:DNA-binding transcriptional regulator HexR [Roseomonas sp. TAS13]|uniref:MurR/RpiR family transcriptional regulator n=1 Tax=Roseomonas sp. TAS13 TaxID=1926319 RepID=UPI00095C586D|nr:MurR/RpiR family transcriptional regulator [Roseomonas sp. TAS13]GAV36174.1 DNA-binding transcriptional regulator HexR [Roseomonas sp. TAS13]